MSTYNDQANKDGGHTGYSRFMAALFEYDGDPARAVTSMTEYPHELTLHHANLHVQDMKEAISHLQTHGHAQWAENVRLFAIAQMPEKASHFPPLSVETAEPLAKPKKMSFYDRRTELQQLHGEMEAAAKAAEADPFSRLKDKRWRDATLSYSEAIRASEDKNNGCWIAH